MNDAPYERAVRVAREAIAAMLREGTTLEELEGGLLERRLGEPGRRPRARRGSERRAYRSTPPVDRTQTAR